ncbi:MAG: hypothetical protein AAES65_04050 [Candidatus Thiodiazotropha sp. (ex. Lucinoma kazani)]
MSNHKSLNQLGWSPSFQQQLTLEELQTFTIGRVVAQHRSREYEYKENNHNNHNTPAYQGKKLGARYT